MPASGALRELHTEGRIVTKVVEAVIVGWRPVWRKWPDTEDTDYRSVRAQRMDVLHMIDNEPVTLRLRWYPVHQAFVRAGVSNLPMPHPWINNTKLPPRAVYDAMLRDFEELAQDGCKLCFWEHAFHCYPTVAAQLKRVFAHSVFVFCDDCPEATAIKSLPVAVHFDSVFHGNLVCAPSGARTRDLYLHLGVPDVQYITLSTTAGFMQGVRLALGRDPGEPDEAFGSAPLRYRRVNTADGVDIGQRMQQLREGRYSNDVVFVGGCLGAHRNRLNTAEFTEAFHRFGLRTKINGYGMRDGVLQPRVLDGMGEPVARLYMDSFAVLNPKGAGLMGSRPFDAWASGSLLFQKDTMAELVPVGVSPGTHYVEYDGTAADLCSKVLYYKSHLDEVEPILLDGKHVGDQLSTDHSIWSATGRVLQRNHGKWWKA